MLISSFSLVEFLELMMTSLPSLEGWHHVFSLITSHQGWWMLMSTSVLLISPNTWSLVLTVCNSYRIFRSFHHLPVRCPNILWPGHFNQSEWLWINVLFSLLVNLIGCHYSHVSHTFDPCFQALYIYLFIFLRSSTPTILSLSTVLIHSTLGTMPGLPLP